MNVHDGIRTALRKKNGSTRRKIIAVTSVAAVTVAVGSAFGIVAAIGGVSSAASSAANTSAIRNALRLAQENAESGYVRPGAGSGSSGYGPGGPSSTFGGVGSAPTTVSTAAEQIGIVDVTSELGYNSAQSEGTGMVLTSNGEILTNNHVVEGSTSISVTVVSTGASYTANVVGTDAKDDIAVLQVSGAFGLHTAAIDGSSPVSLGDAVVGVGNAGGTGGAPSAAAGQVIALNQTITTQAEGLASSETLNGLIESNANIRAGDSGGPLYNASGRIIGIDTAAQSGGNMVAGYSIPISHALTIAREIEAGDASATITIGLPGFLGVEVGQTNGSAGGSAASGPGTDDPTATTPGAAIEAVIPGTAAARLGLAAGDTITAVDGAAVSSSSALTAALVGHVPGQRVTLSWVDAAGASSTATVTLGSGPAA